MPELPEVETIVRDLAASVAGRRIQRISRPEIPVEGAVVEAVERYGKFVVFRFDAGLLLIHLGMTGKLLVSGRPGPHTRASIEFDDGGVLLFDDIRKFGRILWSVDLPGRGPDPLAIDGATFSEMLRARRGRVKPLLLNQQFVRGLGNIYTDESLFRAGIHPLAMAYRLSGKRAEALHLAIHETLIEAIELRGSSVSDYVDASGLRGAFQLRHQVYRKAGLPCPRCGAEIRRILVAQRGTHFCPRCQRR